MEKLSALLPDMAEVELVGEVKEASSPLTSSSEALDELKLLLPKRVRLKLPARSLNLPEANRPGDSAPPAASSLLWPAAITVVACVVAKRRKRKRRRRSRKKALPVQTRKSWKGRGKRKARSVENLKSSSKDLLSGAALEVLRWMSDHGTALWSAGQ